MKWKTVQKKCGKQKEPGSDCTELRALLLFLLLWQAMFKVADRAIVLLLKFFKLFLSGIGKMMQAEVLITLPRSSQKHCTWFKKILAFRRTVLLKMQFALSVKLSIILMNVFAKGQMVRLYQQNAVMWVIHATHTKPKGGHVVPFWWKLWGQEQERHSCILSRFTVY